MIRGLAVLCFIALSVAQRSVIELDPAPSAISAASAYGLAVVDLNGGSLSYAVVATALTGPIIAAHFHLKSTGAIVQTICGGTVSCTGFYLTGTWADPSAFLADFAAGGIYINVHTVTNPAGEIKGYVVLPQSATLNPIVGTFLVGSSAGKGIAELVFKPDGSLDYDVVAAGLTGPVTRAHFHLGAAGVNGGVLFTICDPCVGAFFEGTWPGAKDYLGDLANGNIYINLHTASFPGGEIRGQATVPAMAGRRGVVEMDPTSPTVPASAYGLAVVDLYGSAVRFEVVATGLTGPIRAAHFHSTATGAIVFPICGGAAPCAGNFLTGTWPDASAYLAALAAGGLYINVHTAAFPAGEIRGDVRIPDGPYRAAAADLVGQSAGKGIVELQLNPDGSLDYDVVAAGLTGPVTRAHFHLGAAGVNGGVLFTICDPCVGAFFEGTWPGAKDHLGHLAAAGVYVNLHTASFPAGEIRGQALVVATACKPRPGQSCAPGAYVPTDCAAGTYSHGGSATACRGCAAGKFSTAVGSPRAAFCRDCPAGTFAQSAGSSSPAACAACAGGKYAPAPGSPRCAAVRKGSYSPPGASRPTPCPVDFYCPEDDLPAPVPCPAGKSTLGMAGWSHCVAAPV